MPKVTSAPQPFAATLELPLGHYSLSVQQLCILFAVVACGGTMLKVTTLLAFIAVATTLMGQTEAVSNASASASPTLSEVRLVPITYSDLHCAGFITNHSVAKDHYVMAGWESPNFVRYSDGDYVYLHGSLPEGSEYSIVRELTNPDRQELFLGQFRALREAGTPYAEVGRVKVVAGNKKTSAAQIVFSCEDMLPGDYAIPLQEPEAVTTRHMIPFNRFAVTGTGLRGRILMQKNFEAYGGAGNKVYLNIGSDKGVKAGDYFHIVRGFDKHMGDAADRAAYEATVYDDTQANRIVTDVSPLQGGGTHVHLGDLPERVLGELIVLSVGPKSSTAMVAFSLQDIQVGDDVERDELPPATPAEMAAETTPPQINCGAQPETISVGSASLISCEASAADGQPAQISFVADRGKLELGADHGAVLQTAGLTPGPVHVTATATDQRNLKATAIVTIDVEPTSLAAVVQGAPQPEAQQPAPPQAAPVKVAEVRFAAGSNVLTNDAKTQLNEVALRLGREPETRVMIVGQGNSQTPAGQRLAERRASNIENYFVNDKQVDAKRVQTRTANGDDKAEIWFLPPGAEMK